MTCDYCGDDADRLITVESADASVGYREEMDVCERCMERLKAMAYRSCRCELL